MNVRVLTVAEVEAQEAASWYEDRQAGLGYDFLNAVADALVAIEENPQQFARMETLRTKREVCRAPLRRFPYAVVYEVLAHEVLVFAVAHGKRRLNYWKRRLP